MTGLVRNWTVTGAGASTVSVAVALTALVEAAICTAVLLATLAVVMGNEALVALAGTVTVAGRLEIADAPDFTARLTVVAVLTAFTRLTTPVVESLPSNGLARNEIELGMACVVVFGTTLNVLSSVSGPTVADTVTAVEVVTAAVTI